MSDDAKRTLGRPAEGWLPLLLVAALGLVLASAMDEPAWVNGRGGLTDGLVLCALAGSLVGLLGPKLGWGRWTTHVIGAVLAALLIPVLAGWAVQPGISAAAAFRVTAAGTVQAYIDLAWRGLQFTTVEVHYILVLGGLVWGTLQFGAYAVFGHRRPLAAVLVTGLVLIVNMALTTRDQLGWMVGYAAVSLLLLVRMHAFDEQGTWARRRIGDPSSMSSMYLRGGVIFIVLAMAGSLALTTRAVSSPLARAWDGLDALVVQMTEGIARFLPSGGDTIGGGVAFGSSARIVGRWFVDPGVAFRATVPADAPQLPWRAATYDTFMLGGWQQSDVSKVTVDAGQPLLDGTGEAPQPGPFRTYSVTVAPDAFHDAKLLSPGRPLAVNRDATVEVTGSGAWVAAVDINGSGAYTVQATVPVSDGPGALSANQLRAASRAYPPDIVGRYTSVPTGAIGPDATELLAKMLAASPSRNPYDLALTMQNMLKGPAFTYTTDVRGIECSSASAVECFARTRQGYCLHYASTMAILLRAADPANPIPTRLVQGFLPGTWNGTSVTVTNRDAHAWVEVYFPGYGWIPFDPTGGGIGRAPVLPEGSQVPAATSTPVPTFGPAGSGGAGPSRAIPREPNDPNGSAGGPASRNQPADSTLVMLLALLMAVVVVGTAAVTWLRGPRGVVSAERSWSSLAGSASRLGVRQRPTQTIYEYAATLGDLVPVARSDLRTVADAKVEATYAATELGTGRLEAVRAAMRRLRLTMLRLIVLRFRPRPRSFRGSLRRRR